MKLARYENLLNCTVETEPVESRLRQRFKPFPFEAVEIDALDNDPRTIETKQLLEEVFNGTTQLKKIEGANLRNILLKEIRKFQDLLCFYFGHDPYDDKDHILNQIKGHPSKRSSFTAIKRWIIRENSVMFGVLGEFLND